MGSVCGRGYIKWAVCVGGVYKWRVVCVSKLGAAMT